MSFLSAILPVAKGNVGDLVRYDAGPTALMRVTDIIGGRYYGRAFHSSGTCTSRSEVFEPSEQDREAWRRCHNADDTWIRGAYAASVDGRRMAETENTGSVPQGTTSAVPEGQTPIPDHLHHSSTTPGEE